MIDTTNYYDIVEIGSHPTIENPGKGLGIKTIAERKNLKTLFIAFGKKNEHIEITNDSAYSIIEVPFNHLPLRSKLNPFNKIIRIFLKIIVILNFIFRTIFILNKVDYKLINIHSLMISPLVLFLSKDKKKIITFRGSDFTIFKNSKVLKFIANKCDEFHCVSSIQESFLKKNFNKNVLNIHNMVDTKFFKNEMNESRMQLKNLIVIAGLRRIKGVDRSLKIFKALYKKDSSWVLNICGDGIEKNSLKSWVKKNQLDTNVLFHGSLNRNELKNILNKSCICMIDSRDEGFPKSMLEALSSGCFISHSGKGECKIILSDYGYSYDKFEPSKIANDISNIYSDADRFIRLTIESKNIANKFSIENYCLRIEESYKCLIT